MTPQPTNLTALAGDAEKRDQRSWKRAERAVCSLPYRREFYGLVSDQAISSTDFCQRDDLERLFRGRAAAPDSVENDWIWLIRLGVLRREVDGQGLTERVRLTPMGRQLLATWPTEIPTATPLQRLQHWVSRYRPRR